HRLMNSGVPPGLIKPDSGIDDKTMERIRRQWHQMQEGSRNAGKVAVMPNKLEFQELGSSNQEMQFIEGKENNRDEILANYGVGLEMLGKTDSQTRANADAAIFVFMKFGASPFIEQFCDTLTNDYLPAFPGTEGLEFCFDDPVPENLEEKRANADSLLNCGALTPNERRKMFGLDP